MKWGSNYANGREAKALRNGKNEAAVQGPGLYRLNTGSCNGCDVELAVTAVIPRFDVKQCGCTYCHDPKEAGILLVSGPLTVKMREQVLRLYREIPAPKVVVALGVCPISGGVFRDSYAFENPLDAYLPVDVNVPGCPPRPQAMLEGIGQAVKIWRGRSAGDGEK